MANRLIRSGVSFTVPAQPGRPATPGYYMFVPVYEYVTTEGVAQGLEEFANLYGGGGALYPSTSYEIVRYDRVFVPGTPAVPAQPERRVVSPPAGWNGFARSIQSFVDGDAQFKVSVRVAGVVIGLAPASTPTSGYAHIPAGLLFTGGQVRNKRTNVSYGAFTSADLFQLRKRGRDVVLLRDGVELDTEVGAYSLGQPVHLTAALYSPQDNVFEPSMTPVYYAEGQAAFRGLSSFGGDVAGASALNELPGLSTSAGQFMSTATSAIQGIACFAADRPMGSARSGLAGLSGTAYDAPWDVVPNNECLSELLPLTSAGFMLSGGLGSATNPLAGLAGLAADRSYGAAQSRLSGMSGRAFNFSQDLGFVFDVFGVSAGLSSVAVFDARVAPGFGIDFDLSATDAADEVIEFTAGFGVVMSTSTEEVVDARSIFWFEVPIDVPGAFVDTWVANA